MKLTRAEADAVESMIDRYSLRDVVAALAQIASEKQEHIQSHWSDTVLGMRETSTSLSIRAQRWERAARLLDYASGAIDV